MHFYKAHISKHSDMARNSNEITVLPATQTHTIPAFTPQLQRITALSLVLIVPPTEGWPSWVDLGGWLYSYS